MKTIADLPKRDRWARLRFSIIGPLLAAPPAPGQLHGALQALATRTWRHPLTGQDVRFGASTLERWYYAARRAADPLAALRDRLRANEGCFPSLTPVAIAALTAQYREHPGWTAQLHPGQPAGGLQSQWLARGLVHHGAALPACPGHASSAPASTCLPKAP